MKVVGVHGRGGGIEPIRKAHSGTAFTVGQLMADVGEVRLSKCLNFSSRLICLSLPHPMTSARLYHDLAHLWRLLSPPQDYVAEAAFIDRLLDQRLGSPPGGFRWSILELGGGGGHLLAHLAGRFDAAAVDLALPMLDVCRRLNPTVQTHLGDMRTVRLGRSFHAVLAHDAVDYMVTEQDVQALCTTAAVHLEPGGLFLVGPTYVRESFLDHEAVSDFHTDGDTELAYVSYVHRPNRTVTTFERVVLMLIREHGQLRIEEDRHTCGLFSTDTWLRMMQEAGFEVDTLSFTEGDPCVDQSADEMTGPARLLLGVRRGAGEDAREG